jgi:2-haloacid dehalogenase
LSNVDNVSLGHTLLRLRAPFAVTVTAQDVGAYKPDLAHFHEAFRRFAALGISKDEILHVAQSKRHDHGPANRLGLVSVWVNRQHGRSQPGIAFPSEADPALTVNSLAALAELTRQAPEPA